LCFGSLAPPPRLCFHLSIAPFVETTPLPHLGQLVRPAKRQQVARGSSSAVGAVVADPPESPPRKARRWLGPTKWPGP
jgi:hypothetical protein